MNDLPLLEDGTSYLFTINELKALYRIFWKQWIDHEDEEGLAVVNKISKILGDYERNPKA